MSSDAYKGKSVSMGGDFQPVKNTTMPSAVPVKHTKHSRKIVSTETIKPLGFTEEMQPKRKKGKKRKPIPRKFYLKGGVPTPDPATVAFLKLIDDLGGNSLVVGAYLATAGRTMGTGVSLWEDVRAPGSNAGPALAQATAGRQPAFNTSTQAIEFDGVNDYMETLAAGRLAEFTDPIAIAMCVKFSPYNLGAGVTRVGGELMNAAHINLRTLYTVSFGQGEIRITSESADLPMGLSNLPAGFTTWHQRKATSVGINAIIGGRFGSAAEATQSQNSAANSATKFSLGDWAAGTLPMNVQVKALLFYKNNDWTSGAKFALFNTFCQTYLGATL